MTLADTVDATLKDTVKRLLINISLHFLIVMACGLMINAFFRFGAQTAYITGLCLGAGVSAVKVILMERGISKSLSMKSVSAGLSAVLQITLRNFLSAGILACAVLIRGVSIWGVIAGLLLLQSAAFALKRKGA